MMVSRGRQPGRRLQLSVTSGVHHPRSFPQL